MALLSVALSCDIRSPDNIHRLVCFRNTHLLRLLTDALQHISPVPSSVLHKMRFSPVTLLFVI
jgi:hypothetical protein